MNVFNAYGVVIVSIWTVLLCHDVCSTETQQESIDKLTEMVNAVTERLNGTQEMVDKLKSESESESDTFRGMAVKAMILGESTKSEMVQKLSRMESQLSRMERELSSLKYGVAFTVYMSSSLTRGGILPFSSVLLNHGNHFDVRTYKFTCPVDGIYFFIYNLYSGNLSKAGKHFSGGKLYVDGVHQTTAKSWAYTDGVVAMHETGSAVARCRSGKKVWIEMSHDTEVNLWGSHSKDTTFSGFLLYGL